MHNDNAEEKGGDGTLIQRIVVRELLPPLPTAMIKHIKIREKARVNLQKIHISDKVRSMKKIVLICVVLLSVLAASGSYAAISSDSFNFFGKKDRPYWQVSQMNCEGDFRGRAKVHEK